MRVSILVFMDLGHRRICDSIHDLLSQMFQSLFSWISVIGPSVKLIAVLCLRMFQSLFSWISVIGGDC